MGKEKRPNILLITTDQQRGDCLGVEGHPVLLTPNMDGIAAAGVRFSRFYAACPTCIAVRRSILSGQNPPTHGLVGYQDGVEWDAPVTLPQALRDGGYQTRSQQPTWLLASDQSQGHCGFEAFIRRVQHSHGLLEDGPRFYLWLAHHGVCSHRS